MKREKIQSDHPDNLSRKREGGRLRRAKEEMKRRKLMKTVQIWGGSEVLSSACQSTFRKEACLLFSASKCVFQDKTSIEKRNTFFIVTKLNDAIVGGEHVLLCQEVHCCSDYYRSNQNFVQKTLKKRTLNSEIPSLPDAMGQKRLLEDFPTCLLKSRRVASPCACQRS